MVRAVGMHRLVVGVLLCAQSFAVSLQGPAGTEAFLDSIADSLPAAFVAGLPAAVTVVTRPVELVESEERFGSLSLLVWLEDDVVVVPDVLLSLMRGDEAGGGYLSSRHRTEEEFAQAAVVEGLAKLYDVRFGKTRFSRSLAYQKLTGWQKWMLQDQWKNRNVVRSPDSREALSPEDHFAVNFGYFVLDEEYACRRPAMNLFFREKFGEVAHADRACVPNGVVFLSQTRVPVDLSPERIKEVHYLLASPGTSIISGWGHTMIRFIICDDKQDCMKDVLEHVVLGYQAMTIDDLSIDHIGGLLGKYPSLLFPYMFSQVESRYIAGELRELLSIPVTFSETEKQLYVYKCLEQYWQYSGRYRFLTHNCATEARDDLQGAFLEPSTFQQKGPITPVGIARKMHKSGLVNAEVFEDEEQAILDGYYFPERNPLEELYAELKGLVEGKLKYRAHKKFIKKSEHTYRRELYDRLTGEDARESLRIATLFFNFEVRIRLESQEALFAEAVKLIRRDLKRTEKSEDAETPALDTYKLVQEVFDSLLPWRTVADPSGYGVPLRSEMTSHENEVRLEKKLAELARLRWVVEEVMAAEAPEEFLRYDGTRRNIAFFAGEMDRYRDDALDAVLKGAKDLPSGAVQERDGRVQ